LLLSKQPNAKEILDKIKPYHGWIGIIFCLWGLWGVIQAFVHISAISIVPIWWMTWFASCAMEALLGFILGYEIINQHLLSKNDEVKEKGQQLLAKLTPIQNKLGMIAIGLGIWVIIASLAFMR
jgi:hypothetical protein